MSDKKRVDIGFALFQELEEYIAKQEEKGPLSVYQIETALRNLKARRRMCTDPLMGGKRATLDQSIQYFEDLLDVRREKLGEDPPCDIPSPPTSLSS